MNIQLLIREAFKAQENSYSPYSSCKVGAALLCSDGSIFAGCNIENSSFSLTNCAERTAIFSALASGKKEFEALAVVGNNGKDEYFYPCGACLQVINEFCDENFRIIIAKSEEEYKEFSLSQLLPYSFDKENVL